jgi:hypothetical protein
MCALESVYKVRQVMHICPRWLAAAVHYLLLSLGRWLLLTRCDAAAYHRPGRYRSSLRYLLLILLLQAESHESCWAGVN